MAEEWLIVDCQACGEKSLHDEKECPWCEERERLTCTVDPTPRCVEAQEAVVSALWALGRCGPPEGENGCVRPEWEAGVRTALQEIMTAFGYVVTPIQ